MLPAVASFSGTVLCPWIPICARATQPSKILFWILIHHTNPGNPRRSSSSSSCLFFLARIQAQRQVSRRIILRRIGRCLLQAPGPKGGRLRYTGVAWSSAPCCLRSAEFHRFLMALSERPGRYRAMVSHLLPCTRCCWMMHSSSSGVMCEGPAVQLWRQVLAPPQLARLGAVPGQRQRDLRPVLPPVLVHLLPLPVPAILAPAHHREAWLVVSGGARNLTLKVHTQSNVGYD